MVGSIFKGSIYLCGAAALLSLIYLVYGLFVVITFIIILSISFFILIRINIKTKREDNILTEFTMDHGYGKHEDLYEYHRIMSVKYYSDYK